MQLLTPADFAGRVTAAIRTAAETTGAGFDYLMRTAARESSLDPAAKAPTSSARGLYQFIDQTWLQVLKEDGPKLGLAAAAADVSKSASGRYSVADPARKAELLALRNDPHAAALLAGAFTRRNAAALQAALGRSATEGELYAAHFMGAQGAVELVTLAGRTPDASAAASFPAHASANRAIFYDKGRPRSVAEVHARLTAGQDAAVAPTPLALQSEDAEEAAAPFNGGVENDGRAFHSMFKTGRRSPVSAYVAQAWSSFGAADAAAPFRNVAASPARPADLASGQRGALPAAALGYAPVQSAPAAAKPGKTAAGGHGLAVAASGAAAKSAVAERSAAAVRAAVAMPLDLASFRAPQPRAPEIAAPAERRARP